MTFIYFYIFYIFRLRLLYIFIYFIDSFTCYFKFRLAHRLRYVPCGASYTVHTDSFTAHNNNYNNNNNNNSNNNCVNNKMLEYDWFLTAHIIL